MPTGPTAVSVVLVLEYDIGGNKMTIARHIKEGAKLAVFARNHQSYIEESAKLAKSNPERLITFRSAKPWASAHKALQQHRSMRVFFSPNGADGEVQYEAVLHTIHLEPELGEEQTDKLLAFCLDETKDEGLWGKYNEEVKTLYVVSNCRRFDGPFSMTRLTKASDEEPISENYGYSYTVVFDHLGPSPTDEVISPEEIVDTRKYFEGATKTRSVNAYERSTAARNKCLAHHGFDCAVCEFNFEDRFGSIGEGFIHVHHLNSLSEIDGEYEVDPIEDLRPVCPNCHAMLHKRDPVGSKN
tara:strand:+ start:297 stop:1193 length:897 start_codon:yes stop_codon:yes gene_type:complete